MRKLLILAAALTLTACGSKTEVSTESQESGVTKVETKTNIDGVKTHAAMELTHYAVRAALGQNPNTAAYVTIKNTGTTDDRLVSAACDCADTVELHSMKMDGDKMMMAPLPDGLVIKAGETVELKPGGNHIMLLGLKTRPEDGQTQSVTLTFEKAGSVTVEMPVSNAPLSDAHSGH
ncbi:copper chaperone PCu(A)C [Asticcacaulis sp. BYS171W]|uniref:Copper chaperone PCu(A)C n=1 Tax=Asticcacaulis aquaticus TaxID=2984212 RepID=A0ABT5HSF4_9CAUL|nr:copper chaperone PCu(A)C [Asticcacaulis aquaticus]MDC7682997.1 copper chaperone PCu(A)C [Asticcacaulis aquaticus]